MNMDWSWKLAALISVFYKYCVWFSFLSNLIFFGSFSKCNIFLLQHSKIETLKWKVTQQSMLNGNVYLHFPCNRNEIYTNCVMYCNNVNISHLVSSMYTDSNTDAAYSKLFFKSSLDKSSFSNLRTSCRNLM